jgi:hypothetical protein
MFQIWVGGGEPVFDSKEEMSVKMVDGAIAIADPEGGLALWRTATSTGVTSTVSASKMTSTSSEVGAILHNGGSSEVLVDFAVFAEHLHGEISGHDDGFSYAFSDAMAVEFSINDGERAASGWWTGLSDDVADHVRDTACSGHYLSGRIGASFSWQRVGIAAGGNVTVTFGVRFVGTGNRRASRGWRNMTTVARELASDDYPCFVGTALSFNTGASGNSESSQTPAQVKLQFNRGLHGSAPFAISPTRLRRVRAAATATSPMRGTRARGAAQLLFRPARRRRA